MPSSTHTRTTESLGNPVTLHDATSATVRYSDVAKALGMTEGAVKVAVHRLRRHFRDTLVQEIAETVSDPADIDAEIAYLLKAVSV